MRGEELIVLLGRQKVLIRPRQLHAHDKRLDAAHRKEDESRDDVADADLFMIDRCEPAEDAGLCLPDTRQPFQIAWRSGASRRDALEGHGDGLTSMFPDRS